MWVLPSEIYFTHDSINPYFSCGRGIIDTYEELRTGFKDVTDIPMMTVAQLNGEWYTYTGNRRLWVFRRLQREGYIYEIEVHATNRHIQPSKFTTRNGGVSVKVGSSGAASSSVPQLAPTPRIGASKGAQGSAARNVACPVCGEVRFESAAGAVQHVESGTRPGCRGRENARRRIYDFVRRSAATQQFLNPALMDRPSGVVVCEKPYKCTRCPKEFRRRSDLMQHTRDRHGDQPTELFLL